jgi:hypothetical protein
MPVPLPSHRLIPAEEVPEPAHQLLVHDCHMTVAMESYHRCKIGVRVLQRQQKDDWYARQILLLPVGSSKVVQGGIVRIHLHMLDPEVQSAILREDTPLGHVLINHEVMRHIEVTEYVRFDSLEGWPGFAATAPAYGRLGILYCDHQPAIELFEVVPG